MPLTLLFLLKRAFVFVYFLCYNCVVGAKEAAASRVQATRGEGFVLRCSAILLPLGMSTPLGKLSSITLLWSAFVYFAPEIKTH